MHALTKLIKDDMKPALGVTEPGAIALAVASAADQIGGGDRAEVVLNSGMYKNAFTCGIPNSPYFGNEYAAALGLIAAKPELGLECLAAVTDADNEKAREMVAQGRIKVRLGVISSRIYIEATVFNAERRATVLIKDSHTNIVRVTVDGKDILARDSEAAEEEHGDCLIHEYSLAQLLEYAGTIPYDEIEFVKSAYDMNMELFQLALDSGVTPFTHFLFKKNGEKVISGDEAATASLLCNGAIEARVLGLSKPAMSITGSGAHGIIATLPLYASARIRGYSDEALCRATMLSYLVCTYIKEYSGRLSAFCGCAIAAGTGMACGLAYLRGGGADELTRVVNNMASSITGMICDGGNHGCTMKGIVAVDAAFRSVRHKRRDARAHDEKHGLHRLARHDRHGEGDGGDSRGEVEALSFGVVSGIPDINAAPLCAFCGGRRSL